MAAWIRRRRRRLLASVTFCESCGSVCDRACRARQLRDAHRDRALAMGVPR